MFSVDLIYSIIASFSTDYLIAIGHSLFEKSGLLNLAIDGVFVLSTALSVVFAYYTGSPLVGSLMASLITSIIGVLFAYIMTVFPISHGAVGLSMMFIGYAVGIVVAYPVVSSTGSITVFSYPKTLHLYVIVLLIALITGISVYFILEKTKLGVVIRACGENPHMTMLFGISIVKSRIIAALLGYGLIGLGSSFFTLLWQRYWDIRIYTYGFGWLAFTIALAAGRHPLLLILFSLVFGGLYDNRVSLGVTLGLPVDISKSIPFIAALLAMFIYSKTRIGKTLLPPASLGKAFYREEKAV